MNHKFHKTHVHLDTNGGGLIIIPYRSTTDEFLVIDLGRPAVYKDNIKSKPAEILTMREIEALYDIWPEAREAIRALPKTTDPPVGYTPAVAESVARMSDEEAARARPRFEPRPKFEVGDKGTHFLDGPESS
jgi:hypothetical protein